MAATNLEVTKEVKNEENEEKENEISSHQKSD